MATYSANPTATGAVKPTFTRPMDIFDAQGGSHRVTLSVLKTGPNTWQGELYAQPASDVTQANGLLASGTITFDGNGRLALTAANPTATPPVVPFPATIQPGWTNGANAQPIKLEFGTAGSQDGFSQSEDDSSVLTSSINGGLLGNVASISVSKTGEVSAVFDDGSQRAVFQLPIATVPNPNGLTRSTGNGYTISDLSGAYAINAPGSLGAGEISSYTLEASTADLAREFTNMILFQRAYSASSKIITTVDDMLQEVSNLKR
jgi:flagellar hook protein FlgE